MSHLCNKGPNCVFYAKKACDVVITLLIFSPHSLFFQQKLKREFSMNKKLIAAAIAAAFAAPMAASAEATIYGNLHAAVTSNDIELNGSDAQDNLTVDSRDGQVGIKGSEDLGGGLKGIHKIEANFAVDNGNLPSTLDEVYLGLSSDSWGTALIGREDHPYKTFLDAPGYDPLGDSVMDVDTMLSTVNTRGFNRRTTNNAVAYVSPSFSGFTFGGALVAPEESGVGGAGTKQDGFDAFSLGAVYKAGGLAVAVGYEDLDVTSAVGADSEENLGISASYTFGDFKVAGKYEDTDNDNFNEGDEAERWAVSGTYSFGNNRVGAMYTTSEIESDVAARERDADGWGIFAEHSLSNRTSAYVTYATSEEDEQDSEADQFSIGVQHSF